MFHPSSILVILFVEHFLIRSTETTGKMMIDIINLQRSDFFPNCCSTVSPCECSVYAEICVQLFEKVQNQRRKPQQKRRCSLGQNRSANWRSTDLPSISPLLLIPFTYSWPGYATLSLQIKTSSRGEPVLMFTFDVEMDGNSPAIFVTPPNNTTSLTFRVEISCDSEHFGAECNIFCNPRDDHNGHYRCSSKGEKICLSGWRGRGCSLPICHIPCFNGQCVAPDTCKCRPGWRDPACSQCIPYSGCSNGFCRRPFECLCRSFWGGMLCDRDLDYCRHHSPCANGGQCMASGIDAYRCICPPGFTGVNCQQKTSPCHSNPCSNFGTCRAFGPDSDDFMCICDRLHSGNKCQFNQRGTPVISTQIVPLDSDKISSRKCIIGNERYPNDYQWVTSDCRRCSCHKHVANCSQSLCQPVDCLQPSIVCPLDQTCVSVTRARCLVGRCILPFGQCVPWPQIDRRTAKDLCENAENTATNKRCSPLFLTFDDTRMPVGTTIEQLCHHILLVLLTKKLKIYTPECSLVSVSPMIVKVDLISLIASSAITGLKEVLINDFRHNLTASPILRTILKVGEMQQNGIIHWKQPLIAAHLEVAGNELMFSLTVSILLMFAIVGMLLVLIIYLRRKASLLDDTNLNWTKCSLPNLHFSIGQGGKSNGKYAPSVPPLLYTYVNNLQPVFCADSTRDLRQTTVPKSSNLARTPTAKCIEMNEASV